LAADQQGQPALAAAHRGQQRHWVTPLSELPEALGLLIAEHSDAQELLQRCSRRVVLPLEITSVMARPPNSVWLWALDLAVGVSDARACRAVLVRFLKVTGPGGIEIDDLEDAEIG